ncbi:hypothetical protein O7635_00090 [Asanoa sp. WMMD1127]|uniref:hypothetical protein n=1 Tax=Asanoa sp. WMMD1127 TaxID=3016107 RepID=UPI0024169869|nr:hypothetical protein [Asanoa sp. WMMD1127]MDG4820270.1 hypothetical protein [Asanoa sp. WMMD1127]
MRAPIESGEPQGTGAQPGGPPLSTGDWAKIEIPEFMDLVRQGEHPRVLVGRIILDRLPFTFDSKQQYFHWRDELAEGLQVDGRDIMVVGSAATGRSLNPRKRFGVFGRGSDVDIAVVSARHFDLAWQWFRHIDKTLLRLDPEGLRIFNQHENQYIFHGMIAANYFLGYLPFGERWMQELQRSEKHLPPVLRGRVQRVRIYKDNEALRHAQMTSLAAYRSYLSTKESGEGGPT